MTGLASSQDYAVSYDRISGASYDTNSGLALTVDDTCGCEYDSGFLGCLPIPVDFPHKCFPGNSASQGGLDAGYGITLTPFALTVTERTQTQLTFRIDGKACDAGSGLADCCDMDLYKIQVVLASSQCRVARILIDGKDKSTSYETNYFIASHPEQDTPYFTLKITTLTSEPIARVGSYMTLVTGGECNTVDSLLPGGQFWYAYFNGANVNFNCLQVCAGLRGLEAAVPALWRVPLLNARKEPIWRLWVWLLQPPPGVRPGVWAVVAALVVDAMERGRCHLWRITRPGDGVVPPARTVAVGRAGALATIDLWDALASFAAGGVVPRGWAGVVGLTHPFVGVVDGGLTLNKTS
ncbi:hypothetical protein FOA52_011166 [Chlamydomonas sp. UWO 241]|nr:hypothetical protein FOA52_011166 [Chlamydomonas sp. UWO 241]